jgi:hypothetical protein
VNAAKRLADDAFHAEYLSRARELLRHEKT